MNRSLTTTLSGLMIAAALPALAQDGQTGGAARYPTRYADRPLNLPATTLRANLDLSIENTSLGALGGGSQLGVGLLGGAAFGVTDQIEVGATFLPLALSPNAKYGDIPLYGQFGITKDLALRLTLNLPAATEFGLTVGGTYAIRADALRVDVGAAFAIRAFDPFVYGLQIPVIASYNVMPNLYLSLETGLNTTKFDLIGIPLVVGGYYTIEKGGQPMLDLGASFGWRGLQGAGGFLNFGDAAGDTVDASNFTLLVGGKFYLFL
jgi:hypothetical protein